MSRTIIISPPFFVSKFCLIDFSQNSYTRIRSGQRVAYNIGRFSYFVSESYLFDSFMLRSCPVKA